jgi:hypothetical protein
MAYVAPPPIRMPDPGAVDFSNADQTKSFMINLVASITRALTVRPAHTSPHPTQLFSSPDGSTFEMTVSDAGAPVFTAVSKKTELPP